MTQEQRGELLQPLFTNQWSLVKDRDAIYKEFVFSDFIQVCLTGNLIIFIVNLHRVLFSTGFWIHESSRSEKWKNEPSSRVVQCLQQSANYASHPRCQWVVNEWRKSCHLYGQNRKKHQRIKLNILPWNKIKCINKYIYVHLYYKCLHLKKKKINTSFIDVTRSLRVLVKFIFGES